MNRALILTLRHLALHLKIAVLAFGVLAPANSAQADIAITFGTYAADKPTETVRKFKPFLNFLERELSEKIGERVQIRMKISKAYEDSIDSLVKGDVDFTRFGPASYVTAKEKNAEISIIAVESKKGKKRFNGVIAVHNDSEIASLAELAGQTFAFGDELSTIGRYLAQAELLNAGVSSKSLAGFEYLGRHDLVGAAVGNKSFAAGALKESTFKKQVKKGMKIKALKTFENVTKPWIASASLDTTILEAMRSIMLDPKNLKEVRSIAKNGFLDGADDDYDLIRAAMTQSKNF